MKATIKKAIQETPRIKTFIVEPAQPITFQTGQAMRWNLPGVKVGRLLSVASPGGANRTELWFTVRLHRDGVFTSHLYDLKEGDMIELVGPYGKFVFDPSDGHEVALIAGGSGISVLRAILHHVLDNNLPNTVFLLFSVLNNDEVVYEEELEKIDREHDTFHYELVVTDPNKDWKGKRGFITRAIFDELFGDYLQVFYICGPEEFNLCAERFLKEAGVPDERIHIDRWSFYKQQPPGTV